MEMSRNECQDLKARYEEASSESRAKHEEVLQNLHKLLRDTEERLKATQEENRELLQKLEELGKQAERARVCGGEDRVPQYSELCVLRQGCKGA